MNYILRWIPIETILGFLIDKLLSTIKNPNSVEARRIYSIMQRLREVVDRYFSTIPAPQ